MNKEILLLNTDDYKRFNAVIAKYEKSPSLRTLDTLILMLESILQSLDPVSKRINALDIFENAIYINVKSPDSATLQKVIPFIEKYALIFNFRFYSSEYIKFLQEQQIKPFLPVRFYIYGATSVRGLDVISRMIERGFNNTSFSWRITSESRQNKLANLYHIKALACYRKASLLADSLYKEPDNSSIIEYVDDLLSDSKSYFKEAFLNGNDIADIQFQTLRRLGCFGTLPSLESPSSGISYRLLSAMQLHILSGNIVK